MGFGSGCRESVRSPAVEVLLFSQYGATTIPLTAPGVGVARKPPAGREAHRRTGTPMLLEEGEE